MPLFCPISANSGSFLGALRKSSRSLSHLLMSSCNSLRGGPDARSLAACPEMTGNRPPQNLLSSIQPGSGRVERHCVVGRFRACASEFIDDVTPRVLRTDPHHHVDTCYLPGDHVIARLSSVVTALDWRTEWPGGERRLDSLLSRKVGEFVAGRCERSLLRTFLLCNDNHSSLIYRTSAQSNLT